MSITVIADPGATWKAQTESESWGRMLDLVAIAANVGVQVFKPQLLRGGVGGMYRDNTRAAQLVAAYEVPDVWIPRLYEACGERDLELMVTPYRARDVSIIDPWVQRWKIASFDVENYDLLRAVIATGKPIIVSLGLGQQRCYAFEAAPERTIPLHCVSAYPAPPEHMNLARMRNMTGRHGLSDHSKGYLAAVMAVALGAEIIEKHLRHPMTPGENPDYAAAASPDEFRQYVKAIREAEVLMGDGKHRVQPSEMAAYKFDPATGRRAGD